MKYKVHLEFEAPSNASKAEIQAFIKDWLESGGGCRPPEDPLFNSLMKVKVGALLPAK